MDSKQFDAWTRGLSSRRAALGGLVVGLATLPGWLDPESADARRRRKKRRKKKRNKAKKSPPPGPPSPTCSDGVKNGSETDVDCGGSCPRCANAKACGSRDDCLGGLCLDNICQECASTDQCNGGPSGPCACEPDANGDAVCTSSTNVGNVDDCGDCPTDSLCIGTTPGFACLLPCGAD